jgi:hypothetical protein
LTPSNVSRAAGLNWSISTVALTTDEDLIDHLWQLACRLPLRARTGSDRGWLVGSSSSGLSGSRNGQAPGEAGREGERIRPSMWI